MDLQEVLNENATPTQVVKQIRAIVKKHYNYRMSYNDLRKDRKTRRLKFASGEYFETPKFCENATKAIIADLDAAGIEYISAGFKLGDSDRGDYMYFAVELPVAQAGE